jgi:hypothetical protein
MKEGWFLERVLCMAVAKPRPLPAYMHICPRYRMHIINKHRIVAILTPIYQLFIFNRVYIHTYIYIHIQTQSINSISTKSVPTVVHTSLLYPILCLKRVAPAHHQHNTHTREPRHQFHTHTIYIVIPICPVASASKIAKPRHPVPQAW